MTGLLLLGAAAGSYTAHVGSDTKCSAWQGGEPTDVFHVDTNVNVDTRGGDQSCEELQKKHEVDEVTPMVLTLLTVALLIAFAVCWERKCGGRAAAVVVMDTQAAALVAEVVAAVLAVVANYDTYRLAGSSAN